MTTQTIITTDNIAQWRTELEKLKTTLASIDGQLQHVAALAALGDTSAEKERSELLAQRGIAVQRVSELMAAIDSGELHLKRQAQEEVEAERQRQAALAEQLKAEATKVAKKVDKALAQLESAWVHYLDLTNDRGVAVCKSGGKWSHSYGMRHLELAFFGSAPQVAKRVGIEWALRQHAAKLEDLVP